MLNKGKERKVFCLLTWFLNLVFFIVFYSKIVSLLRTGFNLFLFYLFMLALLSVINYLILRSEEQKKLLLFQFVAVPLLLFLFLSLIIFIIVNTMFSGFLGS
jgi:uncharacterized membrane protein